VFGHHEAQQRTVRATVGRRFRYRPRPVTTVRPHRLEMSDRTVAYHLTT
jgi:hypothetical protein